MLRPFLNTRWNVAALGDYSPNIVILSGGIIRYKTHGNAYRAGWIPVMTQNERATWNALVFHANMLADIHQRNKHLTADKNDVTVVS